MTNAVLRQSMLDHIVILLICLTSAAIAVLLIGALGIGTSLSLNVIERGQLLCSRAGPGSLRQ